MGKVHDLGQVVAAREAWAVYADYDGYAPDSADIVVCADKDLATEAAIVFETEDSAEREDVEQVPYVIFEDKPVPCNLPFNEGHEWCKSYRVRKTLALEENIALTIEQAVKAITID